MAKRRPARQRAHPTVASRRHTTVFTRPLAIGLALVALNLLVFAQVRAFEFVNWDDPAYVTENIHVQQGLSWNSVKWALTTAHSPYWHPLTWLSHLLDVRLFALDAGSHHLTSLALHILNTLLLFGLLRRLTGHEWRSALVAAIFAVHPLHVESVAWVAERKDVLSTFFLLLSVGAYSSYVRTPTRARYAVMSALFVLALMSKPMVVTLPVLLFLLDIWPLRRVAPGRERAGWMGLLIEKIPLLILSVAASVATVMVQHRVGAMASLAALSWTARLSNAMVGYGEYVLKTFWPANLAAFYPFRDHPWVLVAATTVALFAVTVAASALRRRAPALLVGWLWFVIALLPVSGLLQAGEQRIADRFMYLPMIGLLIALAWGIPELFEASTHNDPARKRGRRTVLAVAAAGGVLACAVAARAQTAHWRTSVDLWRHAVRATPDSYIAYENLAQALRERGELEESRATYERALSLAPAHSPAYVAVIQNSLGLVLTRQGRQDDARARFEAAVAANPAFAEPHGNLGNALAAEGRFANAIEHYRIAITLKPDFAEAQLGLGSALLSQGNAAEAIVQYQAALKLDPSLAQAHNGLGASLAREGRDDEALAQYEEALRLKPDLATAHFNLAMLLVKRGRLADARRHAEDALTIDPQYEPAHRLWLWLRTQGEGG
jgi:tetratricopeptide (TPR) repeat protein